MSRMRILTSSTSIDPGKASDSRGNERTESFENSSRKDVRNESTNEPNVDVSLMSCIPYR
jgi:hypothetical protein